MSGAAWLAAGAAAAAVAGAWDAIAAVERTRVAAALARLVEPLRRAGDEGRAPTAPERRRLAAVAAGALWAAGWLVGGAGLGLVAALAGPAAAAIRASRSTSSPRRCSSMRIPMPSIHRVLSEAYRLLQPGGVLAVLDFAKTGDPFLDFMMIGHGARNNEPYMPHLFETDVVGLSGRSDSRRPRCCRSTSAAPDCWTTDAGPSAPSGTSRGSFSAPSASRTARAVSS